MASRYSSQYDSRDRRSRSPRDRSPYNDRTSQYGDDSARRRSSGETNPTSSAFQANRDSFARMPPRAPKALIDAQATPRGGGFAGDFRGRGRGVNRGRNSWTRDDSRDRDRGRDEYRRDGLYRDRDHSRERERDYRDRPDRVDRDARPDVFRRRSPQGRGRSPVRDFRDIGIDADRARRESRDGPLSAGSSNSDPPYAQTFARGGGYRGRGRGGRATDWDRSRGRPGYYDDGRGITDRYTGTGGRSRSTEGRQWNRPDRDEHERRGYDNYRRDSYVSRDEDHLHRDRGDLIRPKVERTSMSHEGPGPKDISPPPVAPPAPAFGSLVRNPSTPDIASVLGKLPPTGPRADRDERPVSAGQSGGNETRLPPTGPSKPALSDRSPPIPIGPRAQQQKPPRPSSKQWINPNLKNKGPESPKTSRSHSFVQHQRPFGFSRHDTLLPQDYHDEHDHRPRSSDAKTDDGRPQKSEYGDSRAIQSARASMERDNHSSRSVDFQHDVQMGGMDDRRDAEPIPKTPVSAAHSVYDDTEKKSDVPPTFVEPKKPAPSEVQEDGLVLCLRPPRVVGPPSDSDDDDEFEVELDEDLEKVQNQLEKLEAAANVPLIVISRYEAFRQQALSIFVNTSEGILEDVGPLPGPEPEPEKQPEPKPESQPESELVLEVVPESIRQPEPKKQLESLPASVPEPGPAPASQSTVERSEMSSQDVRMEGGVDEKAEEKPVEAIKPAEELPAPEGPVAPEEGIEPPATINSILELVVKPGPLQHIEQSVEEMDIDEAALEPIRAMTEATADDADVSMVDGPETEREPSTRASEPPHAAQSAPGSRQSTAPVADAVVTPISDVSRRTSSPSHEDEGDSETDIDEVDLLHPIYAREQMTTPPLERLPYYSCQPWFNDSRFRRRVATNDEVTNFMRAKMMAADKSKTEQQNLVRQEYAKHYEKYMRWTQSEDPLAVKSRQLFTNSSTTTKSEKQILKPKENKQESARTRKYGSERDIEDVIRLSKLEEEERRERAEQAEKEKRAGEKEAAIPDMFWTDEEKKLQDYTDRTGLVSVNALATNWEVLPPIPNFSKDEEELFEKTYLESNKFWGKVADNIPNRNYQSCIQYYYAKKRELNLKEKLKKQPKKRKAKTRTKRAVAELGNGDVETDENQENNENGERRRPRRAAAPTFNSENPGDSENGTPAGTPGRRRAQTVSGQNDSGAEKAEPRKGRRPRQTKQEKEAAKQAELQAQAQAQAQQTPSQAKASPSQSLSVTPGPGSKSNRSRSNSRAVQGPEWTSPHAGTDKVPQFVPFEPPTPARLATPFMASQPIPSVEKAEPLQQVIAEVMAPPSLTLRPEPPPPPQTVFERAQSQKPGRGSSQASSYWSVSESESFPGLLRAFGTDWSQISQHMETKTAIMVKNYYQRNKDSPGKEEWEVIAKEADRKKELGEELPLPPAPSMINMGGKRAKHDPLAQHANMSAGQPHFRQLAAAESAREVPRKVENIAPQPAPSRFSVGVPRAQAPPTSQAPPATQPPLPHAQPLTAQHPQQLPVHPQPSHSQQQQQQQQQQQSPHTVPQQAAVSQALSPNPKPLRFSYDRDREPGQPSRVSQKPPTSESAMPSPLIAAKVESPLLDRPKSEIPQAPPRQGERPPSRAHMEQDVVPHGYEPFQMRDQGGRVPPKMRDLALGRDQQTRTGPNRGEPMQVSRAGETVVQPIPSIPPVSSVPVVTTTAQGYPSIISHHAGPQQPAQQQAQQKMQHQMPQQAHQMRQQVPQSVAPPSHPVQQQVSQQIAQQQAPPHHVHSQQQQQQQAPPPPPSSASVPAPASVQQVRNLLNDASPPRTQPPPPQHIPVSQAPHQASTMPLQMDPRPTSTPGPDVYRNVSATSQPLSHQPPPTSQPPPTRAPVERKTSSLMALLNDDPPAPPPPKRVEPPPSTQSSTPPPHSLPSREQAPPTSAPSQIRREPEPQSYPPYSRPPAPAGMPSLREPSYNASPQPQHMVPPRQADSPSTATLTDRDYYRQQYASPHQTHATNSPQTTHHYPASQQQQQQQQQHSPAVQGQNWPSNQTSHPPPTVSKPPPPPQQSSWAAQQPLPQKIPAQQMSYGTQHSSQTSYPTIINPTAASPPPQHARYPRGLEPSREQAWQAQQAAAQQQVQQQSQPWPGGMVRDDRYLIAQQQQAQQHAAMSARYPPPSAPRAGEQPPAAPSYPRYSTPGPSGREAYPPPRDPRDPRADIRDPAYGAPRDPRDPAGYPRDPVARSYPPVSTYGAPANYSISEYRDPMARDQAARDREYRDAQLRDQAQLQEAQYRERLLRERDAMYAREMQLRNEPLRPEPLRADPLRPDPRTAAEIQARDRDLLQFREQQIRDQQMMGRPGPPPGPGYGDARYGGR